MSSQGLGQSKIGILTCCNTQIIELSIEENLEMVVAEKSQLLTQHLGPLFHLTIFFSALCHAGF